MTKEIRPTLSGSCMLRIELDDLTRPQVLALLEEHLRNMYLSSRRPTKSSRSMQVS